jgi:tRNA(Ile)-lysidine synthetase-like protein
LPTAALFGLEQRLLARWRARPSLPNARLIVGFSGGADSLALALALARIGERAGLEATLAHVDHGQRATSGVEQERALALAARLGLPARARHIPPQSIEKHRGVGREEAMRRVRYRALAAVAREERAAALVLAHQADDQAETLLLHLLRGGGLRGVSAMAEWTERSTPWWPDDEEPPVAIVVWRPMLMERRATLRAYLDRAGLEPIDEPSNDDVAFRRNAIRRDVLPLLERIAPGATDALARHAALAADEDATLTALAAEALNAARGPDGDVRAASLRAALPALRRRALRAWVAESAPDVELSAERTAAALALLEPGRGGAIEIGSGWMLERSGGTLRLRRIDEGAGEAG